MKGFKQGAQTHPGLVETGEALGFAKGGKVKQSPQFRMKTSKQDPKDHGVQPARKGRSQQEIEAGGTPKLKPKFKKGGKVHKTHSMPSKAQGRGKKPVGRGKKAVGTGGETGMHKSGRITKKG